MTPIPTNGPSLDLSDPYQREAEIFPHLTPDQVERAKRFGTVEFLPKGSILFSR